MKCLQEEISNAEGGRVRRAEEDGEKERGRGKEGGREMGHLKENRHRPQLCL